MSSRTIEQLQNQRVFREGRKVDCLHMHLFGRLRAAQGNGEVFRTGGYGRHRRQWVNQLLQKDQEFRWAPQCEEAFNKAKESLSSSYVLVHYNPSLPVILESDASQYGIGAVILHRFPNGDERPIAYASRSLNSSEKNYSQIEKEGLAIIFGVTKYYMYLFGRKFTLRTDHKPLLKIFAPDSATPVLAAARLQRWSLLLSSYQYEIEFKPSAEVASSDALSRLPMQYRKDASVEDKIFQVSAIQLRKHPVSV